jgi:hypothetical protein
MGNHRTVTINDSLLEESLKENSKVDNEAAE